MKYRVLIYGLVFCVIGVAGCTPAAPSSVLSTAVSIESSQPKYVLSAEDAVKIESYKELPDSDEEIIALYHKYFDLSDTGKEELAQYGYTEKQIAQIDCQDYVILIKDLPINPNDPDGRTYGDLEEEARQNYEKYKQERMPTPEQWERLDELGIEEWLLWEMIDEGYDTNVDELLSLSEETLIEMRDRVAGYVLVGQTFQNWQQRIRERYFEITGKKPFMAD